MMIDRRNFVTGAALVAATPALNLVPASPPTLATGSSHPVMMIEGWSVPDESSPSVAIWIRVDRSWRTAWR
jgi:phosphodiesterase/alkaline phosphatase D-like protein